MLALADPRVREVRVQRDARGGRTTASDHVAEECPVALYYEGIPHVVMLASPGDLEDLGVGFTLTEGIVESPAEIGGVELAEEEGARVLRLHIPLQRFSQLLQRRRNLASRSGCGACGAETVEEAIRKPAPVQREFVVRSEEMHEALVRLRSLQSVNAVTGSVHAAAWVLPGAGIEVVREDVGRHNALDKVIGALVRAGRDPGEGYLLITSRASYEMVQKAATAGIPLVAAVSAPTAMAIDVAQEANLTLIGFAREGRHVLYTHPRRLDARGTT